VAGLAAVTVVLAASGAAAGIIWFMTTQPEALYALVGTADNAWTLLAGVVVRLLAAI